MKRIKIANDGDVVLVTDTTELCVHSNALSMLSPKFEAMCAPDLVGNKPTRLEVDDLAEGMRLLCLIAHQQIGKLRFSPVPSKLLQLAIAAAKILKRNKGRGDTLEAAIILDNAKYFNIFTEALILRSGTEIIQYSKKNKLQSEVVRAITSSRDTIYMVICERLTEVVKELVGKLDPAYEHFENKGGAIPEYYMYDAEDPENKVCDFWKDIVFRQLRTLSEARLWPPEKRSTTVEWLYEDPFKDPQLPKKWNHDCGFHEGENGALRHEMEKIKNEVARLQPSLCLDCFKAKGKAKNCRVPHKKLKHY